MPQELSKWKIVIAPATADEMAEDPSLELWGHTELIISGKEYRRMMKQMKEGHNLIMLQSIVFLSDHFVSGRKI